MAGDRAYAVLFVCTGNICRSPTAQGVFSALLAAAGLGDRVRVDSAGILGWQQGKPPDPLAVAAAQRRGIDLSGLRARQIEPEDFDRFDLLLAMDMGHAVELQALCPAGRRGRIRRFLDFAPGLEGQDVPDPYGGDPAAFERVYELIERGAAALLVHVRRQLAANPPR